jgi:hypothetical protein
MRRGGWKERWRREPIKILLLGEVEVCCVHYLETFHFGPHGTHVLCSSKALMPLVVLLQRQNKNLVLISFSFVR